MPEVVIIPVHNQLPYLIKCVDSVLKNTDDLQLIIVDDGSTDEATTKWIIDNENMVGYKRIYHEKAAGFTKSCNDGIDYAMLNCDFTSLCLLNSDTVIRTPHWFQKVNDCFDNGEKIGVASVMSDNALAQTVRNQKQYFDKIDSKPTVYSYLVHGFCYFISRELLMTIGHLDDDTFPHYGSEDDFSIKSLQAGFHNLLVGSVFVHHNNSTSYTQSVRSNIVLKSVPDLLSRWGRGYVDKCGVMSLKAANYVNKA